MKVAAQAASLDQGVTVFSLPAGQKWVAKHQLAGYVEGRQFTDEVINQPFAAATRWRHTHRFEAKGQDTVIRDTIDARVPRKVLIPALTYRQNQLKQDLAFLATLPRTSPLTIAVTGSHGMVGTALCAQLGTAGHTVVRLVRGDAGPGERQWDPHNPAPDLLEGVDAVAHLAGEPIFGRFSADKKQKIRDSRVEPTRKLAHLAQRCGVGTFVSASAVGYYGTDAGGRAHLENDGAGTGFLAEVCADWEEAAHVEGMRVVTIRTGLALSGAGGLLPVLRASVSAGLGARFGEGNFWMSWIAVDDLTDIYTRALLDTTLNGPVNATAPNPVTNAEMSRTLARVLRRPAPFPIPPFGPKLLLGAEGARELALADQKVAPGKITHFRYPTLESALAHELGLEGR
ncbi:TIGR01777 family oxidoreductase [Corynebacterium mayonis]|uniref:TIGR01777 family oxidoreductase n=1 Tax=Corynebacterium mayonis TaxID=3062461 RepID=UPI00314033F8